VHLDLHANADRQTTAAFSENVGVQIKFHGGSFY
jgi:hypothetical protein